jgi:hypothetical protein
MIPIAILVDNVLYMDRQQIKGHMIKEDKATYLVDFSDEAERLELYGDYSSIRVDKDECKELL